MDQGEGADKGESVKEYLVKTLSPKDIRPELLYIIFVTTRRSPEGFGPVKQLMCNHNLRFTEYRFSKMKGLKDMGLRYRLYNHMESRSGPPSEDGEIRNSSFIARVGNYRSFKTLYERSFDDIDQSSDHLRDTSQHSIQERQNSTHVARKKSPLTPFIDICIENQTKNEHKIKKEKHRKECLGLLIKSANLPKISF
ncbi:hypothetical protein Tco_0841237 [Tanacetum coccineum]|uniref:Uncharacterized protein n=1 Tax=Tanacetum coccineum TaxID=301880 RepID=A0ABQ5AVU2_9ASTR